MLAGVALLWWVSGTVSRSGLRLLVVGVALAGLGFYWSVADRAR